jgi:hypothetical protein
LSCKIDESLPYSSASALVYIWSGVSARDTLSFMPAPYTRLVKEDRIRATRFSIVVLILLSVNRGIVTSSYA